MGIRELDERREKGKYLEAKLSKSLTLIMGLWLLGKYGDCRVYIKERYTGRISIVLTRTERTLPA